MGETDSLGTPEWKDLGVPEDDNAEPSDANAEDGDDDDADSE